MSMLVALKWRRKWDWSGGDDEVGFSGSLGDELVGQAEAIAELAFQRGSVSAS